MKNELFSITLLLLIIQITLVSIHYFLPKEFLLIPEILIGITGLYIVNVYGREW